MNRALFAAASGMAAQQKNLETIAQNLSNAQVAGFKAAAASFTDIASPAGGSIGTMFAGNHTVFTQGRLVHGGGPFDLAIEGAGFFAVLDNKGRRAYTRDGEFSRASDGTLQNAQGLRLEGIRIPENALSAAVSEDGTVTAAGPRGKTPCGRIRLWGFPAPESLQSLGGTLFFATHASGKPRQLDSGSPGGPAIRFGMLEQSNVSIIEAMMEILGAQRAYEANAKGVQAADEMMRIADNIARG